MKKKCGSSGALFKLHNPSSGTGFLLSSGPSTRRLHQPLNKLIKCDFRRKHCCKSNPPVFPLTPITLWLLLLFRLHQVCLLFSFIFARPNHADATFWSIFHKILFFIQFLATSWLLLKVSRFRCVCVPALSAHLHSILRILPTPPPPPPSLFFFQSQTFWL